MVVLDLIDCIFDTLVVDVDCFVVWLDCWFVFVVFYFECLIVLVLYVNMTIGR